MKSYGTATLTGGRWKVEAEPHVVLRLKRVFGKIGKVQHGALLLSDTPENARDLEWFRERYPLDVEPAGYLAERAAAHRDQCSIAEALISGSASPRAFDLAEPARDYQRVAADVWLCLGGLLLADDVGTGKTLSAICGLTDPRTRPALVVTLTHLPRQWAAEMKRFAPELRVHVAKKATPDLKAGPQLSLVDEWPDVIVLNYHKLSGWAETLAGRVRSVIFDEVQELRHDGTARYKAATHIAERADFRIGLSATPIFNLGGEIYNVVQPLRPFALGERSEFFNEWCTYHGQNKWRIKKPEAFGAYARDTGLILRRTRADVGRELPPCSRIVHEVDADTAALDKIQDAAADLARLILSINPTARGEKWKAAEELSHLVRQATGVAKAPYVADFVRLLIESGERVLLYGWHHEVYGLWNARLKEFNPAFFTGKESGPQKEEAKRRFIAGETPLLVMSLRAGAGLDGLQGHCRTVVFGELDWSPGVHEQAIGRVYRDGQGDPVAAYFLVADSGSDPIVRDSLRLKESQVEGIRDPYSEMVERLQVDEGGVKRLAAALLRQRGESIPDEVAA